MNPSHHLADNGLITGFPFGTVLPTDDGLRQIVSVLIFSEFEPFMFDDEGSGSFPVGLVHHDITLVIRYVEHFGLKTHGAKFEMSKCIIEVGVDGTGVDDVLHRRIPICFNLY